ncbi:D(2) dopamine receptor-like [Strongylocentrotus purpuratus]|uniref:G-protein coupled receptors family 1 profile domain-containing protein n=1 Tax=Strongylocentrotus purpuratus TaxID=7668 RepID=A0A7M7REK7_STRPU|nr:D(2) dopamine receptor-like [Strongylocentrotus purpuratus]|eukprot:XP_794754.1 PREDICTED: D(2) dopamine receptor-like [Strongylocentrotus purpuratus]
MTEQRVIFNSTTALYGISSETHVGFGENTTIVVHFSWCPMDWSWLVILQLISAITGIVGNFLVIVVLLHRRSKNRATDTLIGGLAFADFLTSIFLIPIPTPVYIPKTWLGEVYCRLVFTQSLLWASITVSAYLLMSISVERYIAVVYPLHFKRLITRRRISTLIVIIWFLSILTQLFTFFAHTVDTFTNTCKDRYINRLTQIIVAFCWFCLILVVPSLTMLITQVLIARKLSDRSNQFRGMTNSPNGKQTPSFHIVARNRVLKMMLVVILIYLVCWTPNQIAYLGYNIGWVPESYLNSPVHSMLTFLGFYNSCANPIIYAARYPEFREALKEMLSCNSTKNTLLFGKRDVIEIGTVGRQTIDGQI